jgi:hypothetical protein
LGLPLFLQRSIDSIDSAESDLEKFNSLFEIRTSIGRWDFLIIGILGGTGNMGRGLAIRWALKHDVVIGSRSSDRASEIAKDLENIARGFYQAEMKGSIKGII